MPQAAPHMVLFFLYIPIPFLKTITFKTKPKTVLLAYRVDSQAVSPKSIQF